MEHKADTQKVNSTSAQFDETDDTSTSTSTETSPILIYGKRRIKKAKIDEFKKCYQAFSKSIYEQNQAIKAMFAFPDNQDPFVYWHIVWVRNAKAFSDFWSRPCKSEPLWDTYACSPEDPDTLTVYGEWDEETKTKTQTVAGVRYELKKSIAGFIKPDGGKQAGPALFGFTLRTVKPGRIQDLGNSFQTVCDIWQKKIPGILMAAVFLDENTPNLVHDLRIFANHNSYLAHVDKSDAKLTQAMGIWFENYDTSIPFSGQLYAASTKDEALHTSSIKSNTTPRAQLDTYHFGGSGMLGQMPNMTRND
jgi:hypothetical protein